MTRCKKACSSNCGSASFNPKPSSLARGVEHKVALVCNQAVNCLHVNAIQWIDHEIAPRYAGTCVVEEFGHGGMIVFPCHGTNKRQAQAHPPKRLKHKKPRGIAFAHRQLAKKHHQLCKKPGVFSVLSSILMTKRIFLSVMVDAHQARLVCGLCLPIFVLLELTV